MSTRKRSRKINETDSANTQHIQTKVSRKKKTSHTDTDTVDADEQKIDTNGDTMNVVEGESATSSTERANGDSTEFDQNSNPTDGSSEELDTDNVIREADVLIAEIQEFRREMNANLSKRQNDSEATIIISETTDAAHPTTSSQDNAGASNSANANNSSADIPIDDSVVLIDDTTSGAVRPIIKDEDEDVIFVTECRVSQRFRTIATIDLCDTPDTSFTRQKDAEQSTSKAAAAAAAATSNATANETSPRRPGTTKCPICLETFGFHEILSTMCGHLYCEPCIRNVIKTRKKCPMCNRGLKQNQVHRIFLES